MVECDRTLPCTHLLLTVCTFGQGMSEVEGRGMSATPEEDNLQGVSFCSSCSVFLCYCVFAVLTSHLFSIWTLCICYVANKHVYLRQCFPLDCWRQRCTEPFRVVRGARNYLGEMWHHKGLTKIVESSVYHQSHRDQTWPLDFDLQTPNWPHLLRRPRHHFITSF